MSKITNNKVEEEVLSNQTRNPRTRNLVKSKEDIIKLQVVEKEQILDAEHIAHEEIPQFE
jgi:hypothetical protein